jgi:cellulase (glycosyl hydrolase family 5)
MLIRTARRTCAAAALACGLLGLGAAAPAHAAPFMVSIMQDDNQLVYGTAGQRITALQRMKALGVDAIRVTVLWEVVATRQRIRDGANPAAYPPAQWDRFDELVKSANGRGIQVYFNVTGPGPRWARARSPDPANRRSWKPKVREFRRFVQAIATRYSGGYRDENAGRGILPRVSWWSIWNEPNQGGWLTPQARRSSLTRHTVPASPALYRDLLAAGAGALVRTGHAGDLVLFGETAPLGLPPHDARKPLRPALFLRELFCLNRRYKRYRGAQADARRCDRVKKLRILSRLSRLAYAHHPYTKKGAPTTRPHGRDAITIANIGKLPSLLDRIARKTKLIPSGMSVLLTEFGYETNPPDPFNGLALDRQAAYINEGDYLAYRNSRVFATTQFQLFDVPPKAQFPRNSKQYWFTYQSGLFTDSLRPKPAAFAYVMPLDVRHAGGTHHLIWGQVRFTPNGARQTVYVQVRPPGAAGFRTAGTPITVTSHMGFYEAAREAPPGSTWRAIWVAPDASQFQVSRTILVP